MNGHPNASYYSPEQCLAFAKLIQEEKNEKALTDYTVQSVAHHGDKRARKKFTEALTK